MREPLPDTRESKAHKFILFCEEEDEQGNSKVVEMDGYIHTSTYPDGVLGEVFIKFGKEGSQQAVYDQWCKTFSTAIRYGVPARVLLRQQVGTRFKPYGSVKCMQDLGITHCSSVLDLVARFVLTKHEGGIDA